MRRCLLNWAASGLIGLLSLLSATAGGSESITVAAAASLRLALPDIAAAFHEAGNPSPTLVFGASGSLARQIEHGAPYDVFASADEVLVKRLIEQGLIAADSLATYAEGVLALAVSTPDWPAGSDATLDATALRLLLRPRFRVIAIANPALAPYGNAAREALRRSGLWDALQPRIVYGDNVRQVLTYLETGNAEAALLAASLLHEAQGNWRPIAGSLHRPIRQTVGVLARSPRARQARRFVAFLFREQSRAILRRYGLRPPSGRGSPGCPDTSRGNPAHPPQ